MRKTTLLLGLAFAVSTLSGCDDDVTKLCKNVAKIAEKEEKAPKSMSDIEKCKTQAEEDKKKDPEGFKKSAECMTAASDMNGIMQCAKERATSEKKDDGEEKKE